MKREEIEKKLKDAGVPEEKLKVTVEEILAENGKDVTAAKESVTEAKDKELNTANETIKGLRETVEKFDGVDVEKLKNDAKELQVKYDTDIQAEKAKNEALKKEYALKDALREEGALDPEYILYKQGGVDKFAFDSTGKPIGLSDLIKPIKEATPALFKTEDGNSNGDNGGSGSSGFSSGGSHGGGIDPDLDKLSDEEYYAKIEEQKKGSK